LAADNFLFQGSPGIPVLISAMFLYEQLHFGTSNMLNSTIVGCFGNYVVGAETAEDDTGLGTMLWE
jgi:hypothetical protein